MNRPPMLMTVQIRGEERKFLLWLPLFLVLPLALLLLIILSPLILVAVVILQLKGRRGQVSRAISTSLGLLCSVPVSKLVSTCSVRCTVFGLPYPIVMNGYTFP
jgi:hypothetical protein